MDQHLLGHGSDSALSSAHSLHLNQSSVHPERQDSPLLRSPPPPTRQERAELERLLGRIEGSTRGSGGERETAILDDGDSLPSGTLRLNRSCSCRDGYRSQRCAEPGCDRTLLMPNGYCLDRAPGTNGHHGATPSASPGSAAPPSHVDLCQHYSPPHPHHQALPPPDLVWDRQAGPPPSPHYLHPHRHLCPYQPPDLALPPHPKSHHHLYCRDDEYAPYHGHPHHHYHHPPATTPPPGHHHPHHPKPPTASPTYQDIMLLDAPCCPCRECSGSVRREEPAPTYHSMRLDRTDGYHWDREAELQQREAALRRAREAESPRELHWERDPGLKRGREMSLHWDRDREAELQWERDREAEYWHRRATVASYGPQGHDIQAFTFDHPEASRPHSHAHLDAKYSSSSSGYQTPRQTCPCSPYQPSPSESRGYASGYQSESTSPLPPPSSSSAMPGPCSHHSHQHQHQQQQQSYGSDSHTGETL